MMSNLLSKIDSDTSSFHTKTVLGLFFALFCVVLLFNIFLSIVALTGHLFVSNFEQPAKKKILKELSLEKTHPEVSILNELTLPKEFTSLYQHIQVESTVGLKSKLREFNLWSVENNSAIPPVIFTNYPDDLASRAVNIKKIMFFNTLLPSILIVQAEIMNERRWLEQTIDKINIDSSDIVFDWKTTNWQHNISQDEILKIMWLVKKYRTPKADVLLGKINKIPASLILAQGAIESSWGCSRFSREGNNLFGIWTWKGQGLVPSRREENKTHRVASYPSLIDSVRAYCLTINRFSAYKNFRKIRLNTDDSINLADGLLKYSQKGIEYVNDVKSIIRVNNLKKFDTCYLES